MVGRSSKLSGYISVGEIVYLYDSCNRNGESCASPGELFILHMLPPTVPSHTLADRRCALGPAFLILSVCSLCPCARRGSLSPNHHSLPKTSRFDLRHVLP